MLLTPPTSQGRAAYISRNAVLGLGMAALGFPSSVATARDTMVGRSYTKTTTEKKRKRPVVKNTVKRQMLRVIDNHHSTMADVNYSVGVATHNTLYTANITSVPVQGTTNAQRIGDKIQLQHLDLSIQFNSAAAAGAYSWRLMIVWSGEEYNPAGLASGLAFTGLFLPNTGSNLTTNSIVNPKAVTILMDETFDINSLVAAVKDTVNLKKRIRLNQQFMYDKTGAVYGKTKNLYFVAVGTVIGGTSGVTSCGDIGFNADLVFKPL